MPQPASSRSCARCTWSAWAGPAVSRHHRSGKKNELMDRHEAIASLMQEHEEEIVYTTPSRFKVHFKGNSQYVNITDMTLACGDVELISSANLKLNPGARYGLVGKNGCGKSTLLKRIASGNVQNFPAYMTSMYVDQELAGSEETALAAVLAADKDRVSLLAEEAILLQLPQSAKIDFDDDASKWKAVDERLLELYEEMDELEMDLAEARAYEALEAFSFTPEMIEQPTSELSGGWRMKVALASAIFMKPDILLLDEPTNHLDLHGVLWLQRHLVSGAHDASSVVVVSHDAAFLNAVSTETIIFAGKTLSYHLGNFEKFATRAAERTQSQRHAFDAQDRKRKHMEESIQKAKKSSKKLGDKGNAGGLISSRTKALGRLGHEKTAEGKRWKWSLMGDRRVAQEVRDVDAFKFKFPDVEKVGYEGPLLQLDNVSFAYPGDTDNTLSGITMDITASSRMAIVGRNGAGKSTLMGLLRGSLEPTSGKAVRHRGLKIACYTQHHVDQLNLDHTPIEHMRSMFPDLDLSDAEIRQQLGKYGISGSTPLLKIKLLSGGQRSRVVFAVVTWGRPQVLLLDEPTNHLDFESINALCEALQSFGGAVVLISHNQALIESVVTEDLYQVRRGQVRKYPGTFGEYRERILKSMR